MQLYSTFKLSVDSDSPSGAGQQGFQSDSYQPMKERPTSAQAQSLVASWRIRLVDVAW